MIDLSGIQAKDAIRRDIDEPQDMVTRLIHCAHMMDRETLERLTDLK